MQNTKNKNWKYITQPVKPSDNDKEPAFVKIYLRNIGALFEVPEQCNSFMYELVKRMDEDNLVCLAKKQKENVIKALGIAMSTYHKYMKILVNRDILQKEEHNLFMFNPDLFVKTQWDNVKNLRNTFYELLVRYNSDTGERFIETKVVKKRKTVTKKPRKTATKTVETVTEKPKTPQIPVNLKNVHFLADKLFVELVQKYNVIVSKHEYLEPFFKGMAVDLANGNRPIKKELTLKTFTSYLEKTFLKEVGSFRDNSKKTTYRKTQERLTDCGWAEGIDENAESLYSA